MPREISGKVSAAPGEGVLIPASVRVYDPYAEIYRTCSVSGNYQVDVKEGQGILFVAKGFAPLWLPAPEGNSLDAQLSAGRTVSGTIIGPDAAPVAGAEISLSEWLIPLSPDKYSEWGKEYGGDRNSIESLPDEDDSAKTVTDSNGRFELNDMPKKFRIALSISAPGMAERRVYVRAIDDGEYDQRAVDFPKQTLVEDDFEVQLEKSSVLSVVGVEDESGQPAKIRAISIGVFSRFSDREFDRKRYEVNDATGSINLRDCPFGFYAWIEPVDDDRLTGCRVKFPPNSKGELVEHEVRFKSGKTLRGVVKDEQTDEPIENVPLVWRSSSMKPVDKDGNFATLKLRTDSAGLFEVAVPKVDGMFGIAGDVPGYQSDFGWNRKKEYEEFAPEILKRFTREVSGSDEEAPFEFWLRPSYRLNISTVSESGEPVANCTVFGKFHEPAVFRTSASVKSVSKTTDSDGKATFLHWYRDAYRLKRSLTTGNDGNASPTYSSVRRPPNRLTAFSDGGVLIGSCTVPFPDVDAETNEVDVTMVMRTTGNIAGIIQGYDGEPIAGIWIQAIAESRNSINSGLGWWTTTRDDGRFLLQNIPADLPLSWRIDSTRTKTRNRSGRIDVDTSRLRSGETLEIQPIVVMDLTRLKEPLADLDLETLDDEEALVALQKYAEANLAKVPEDFDFGGEGHSGSAKDEADSLFVQRLAAKLEALAVELADRDPGGDFELKVLAAGSSWFDDGNNGGPLGHGNFFNHTIHSRLLKNHVENESAQKALLRFTDLKSRGLYDSGESIWRALREKSPFKETKAIASLRLIWGDGLKALKQSRLEVTDEEFERHFSVFEDGVETIVESAPKLDGIDESVLRLSVKSLQSQTAMLLDGKRGQQKNRLTRESTQFKARLKKVLGLLQRLSDKL